MTKTYIQIDLDNIQTSETHADGSFTSGIIRKNETRTRTVQDGTEEVLVGTEQVQTSTESISIGFDESGVELFEEMPIFTEQDVFETQPKFIEESYSPWDEMVAADLAGDISVTWLDEVAYQTEQDAITALQAFKSNRQSLLDNAVVTANNFEFDADEISIGRMASALIAVSDELDTYALGWSLASTATGVMTTITKADLKLAHQLAVQNMANIWSI